VTDPIRRDLADLNAAAGGLLPDDPTAIGSTYGRTDWDNGRRLALYEARNLRYVNDLDAWYRWCGDRWCEATRGDQVGAAARTVMRIVEEAAHVEDEDDRARHAAFATASLSERALGALMSTARGVESLRAASTDFDERGHLLNLANCTLDPLTLDWHPHDRDDMLTQLCPTAYVPDAESSRLHDFIKRFLPDKEERAYLLQLLAVSALSWGNDARRLVLLLGPTATGKSTLMDLVKRTLGGDYVAAVNPSVFRGNLDDRPRPDLLRAVKTRLVLAFEASERWDLHPDQIKRMTGGDPITARAMRSNVMNETVASFVPFVVANTPPQIHGADDALRRRLVAVLMDAHVLEGDDDGRLRYELVADEDARRALLALLVRIYHECGGRVALPLPHRFAQLTMEMFAALDDVDEVLRALVEEGSIYPLAPGANALQSMRASVLYRCYTTWLQRNGTPQQRREQVASKQFSQRLKSLGYEVVRSDGMRVLGWGVGDTSTTNVARF
jgi:P4 family phage/plasmid primase-like protien